MKWATHEELYLCVPSQLEKESHASVGSKNLIHSGKITPAFFSGKSGSHRDNGDFLWPKGRR